MNAEQGDVGAIREALDWYSQHRFNRLAVKPAAIRGRRPEAALDRLAAALERAERERDSLMADSWRAFVELGGEADGDLKWHCTPVQAGVALIGIARELTEES